MGLSLATNDLFVGCGQLLVSLGVPTAEHPCIQVHGHGHCCIDPLWTKKIGDVPRALLNPNTLMSVPPELPAVNECVNDADGYRTHTNRNKLLVTQPYIHNPGLLVAPQAGGRAVGCGGAGLLDIAFTHNVHTQSLARTYRSGAPKPVTPLALYPSRQGEFTDAIPPAEVLTTCPTS